MSPVEYDALSKRVEKSFSNGLTIKRLADHIAALNRNVEQLGDALTHLKLHVFQGESLPNHIAGILDSEDKSVIKLDPTQARLYHEALDRVVEAIKFHQVVVDAVFEGKSPDIACVVDENPDPPRAA